MLRYQLVGFLSVVFVSACGGPQPPTVIASPQPQAKISGNAAVAAPKTSAPKTWAPPACARANDYSACFAAALSEPDDTLAYVLALYANVISLEKQQYAIALSARTLARNRFAGGAVDELRTEGLLAAACKVDKQRSCLVRARLLFDQGSKGEVVLISNHLCRGGYTTACLTMGYLLERKHPRRAYALYKRLCRKGSVHSCTWIARAHFSGTGTNRDRVKSVRMLRKACASNYATACGYLAGAMSRLATPNWPEARKFAKRACDGKYDGGCRFLAEMHLNGKGGPKNTTKALALFRHGCESLQSGNSCASLANVLKRQPGGVVKAVKVLEYGCFRNLYSTCNNLAIHFWYGQGVTKDQSKAHELFRHSCDRGDPRGCFNLGNHYLKGTGVVKNRTLGLTLLERSCSGGFKRGCDALAHAKLPAIERERIRLKRRRKRCDGGHSTECFLLAEEHRKRTLVKPSNAIALGYYDFACQKGRGFACQELGKMFEQAPKPIVGSIKAALQAYKRGCELTDRSACLSLARLYKDGKGTRRNTRKARRLYKKACAKIKGRPALCSKW